MTDLDRGVDQGADWGRLARPRVAPGQIWFHGASLGDVRALAPLVDHLATAGHPGFVTAQTATGRQLARQLWPTRPVGSPPLDLAPFPARALRAVRPPVVVLEYLELWPAWMAACDRLGVPTVVVDGRVGPRSLRFRRWLRPTAARLTWFCAQTEGDAERAAALGVRPDRISIHGNAKHDGVPSAPPRPSQALTAAVGPVAVVVGSLHPDEEAAALPALAASGLRLLIAPRYPRRAAAILAWARRHGVPAARRSTGGDPQARWVVLDTVGELAAAYALAPVALVAGTFGRRDGQNLVEPAAQGCAVVHGPRVRNVALEAAALARRGAETVADFGAALAAVRRLGAQAPAERADPRAALAGLRGATLRHAAVLARWLPDRPAGVRAVVASPPDRC